MSASAIVHVGIDEFYTAIELLERPELAGLPLAICSEDPGPRCTILAANGKALDNGVRAGQRTAEAKKRCPAIAVMTPRFELYQHRSEQIQDILGRYGSSIEPLGLDAYWMRLDDLDVGTAADGIAREINSALGLVASVGVSYNRTFARLASKLCVGCDVMVVTPDNYRELIWPMPVDSLLFVGMHTESKLRHLGIDTIGQLAETSVSALERLLGPPGRALWNDANGQGSTLVGGRQQQIEAISNSWTLPRHATSFGEIVGAFRWLSENVAQRAATLGYLGRALQIAVTDMTHVRQVRQMELEQPSREPAHLLAGAMHLFREHFNLNIPIYAVGLSLREITSDDESDQISFDELADPSRNGPRERADSIRQDV